MIGQLLDGGVLTTDVGDELDMLADDQITTDDIELGLRATIGIYLENYATSKRQSELTIWLRFQVGWLRAQGFSLGETVTGQIMVGPS